MRVLSVDPGLGTTGFSLLDVVDNKTRLSAYGTIKSKPKDTLPQRLNYLFEEMNKILDQFLPDVDQIGGSQDRLQSVIFDRFSRFQKRGPQNQVPRFLLKSGWSGCGSLNREDRPKHT